MLENYNPSTIGLLIYIKGAVGNPKLQEILRTYLYEYTTDSGRYPHEILEETGLIEYIKGTKNQPLWEKVRLTRKAQDVLKNMYERPPHHLAQFMLDQVQAEYERIGADRKYIQGGDKLLFYISEFLYSREVDYTETMIRAVARAYCSSFEYDRKYLNSMKTLFFKPTNVYATKFTLESCPLHQWIQSNQDLVRSVYKKLQ